MYRSLSFPFTFTAGALAAAVLVSAGCTSAESKSKAADVPGAAVHVDAVAAIQQPVARFIRATGTLTAEDQADVAAETTGRVVGTPVERGSRVAAGSELLRLSDAETAAQLKEAEANAAQIEARLGLGPARAFDVESVPEVLNAKAALALAESDFNRVESLRNRDIVSRSDFDQRRTQLEAAHQQYESAKNAAAQQYQSLQAARARVELARKAQADTVVRAPFAGSVVQRFVSVGDYVTRGTKVVQVVRINPLRARLTVPQQDIPAVAAGQAITFEVDAYPGRQFTGAIRYVSPAVQADQRALTVEAVVPNADGELKPGLFATARIQQPNPPPAIVVPAAAVQTTNGVSRVYVVSGDHVEERIVTTGVAMGDRIEITNGVTVGEKVAATHVAELADGMKVQ